VPLLSFEGVCKSYRQGRREVVVLEDVCFEVEAGDHVALLAERRAGRSTLLRLAAGIELADKGVVRFQGRNLAELAAVQRARLLREEIGFVATSPATWDGTRSARVVEHVATPLLADGWTGREAVATARSVLESVGAGHCADLRPGDLSLGELTRVAIGRGLIRGPRLLLVDEPAATLSPHEQDEVRDLLRTIGSGSELTLMVASEDPALLRGAGRVMSLSDGRVLTAERPGTLVTFPDARQRKSPAK
jgi:predicted ABC-type transport system involved in lysophospholipase L1 biosynthesis ATPase subunit